MLKKRLGAEAIESSWSFDYIYLYYKIPSTLIIPEGCKVIGRYAFQGCCDRLKKVVIPESVDWIGNCAFLGCGSEVILRKPKSKFKEIGEDAFSFCKSVEYVKEKTRN